LEEFQFEEEQLSQFQLQFGQQQFGKQGQQREREFHKILSKLQSFVSKLHLSAQNAHHTMIVTIIILEYACRFRASSPDSTRAKALDKAYSRYKQSGTHEVVKSQFPGSPNEYSILQFTGFVLQHRLSDK